MMRRGPTLGLLLGLAVNTVVQAWAYHTFHKCDNTSAVYWAGFLAQFSWIRAACSGALFLVLGELAQQKADQRALVRELEAELRAKRGGKAPAAPVEEESFMRKVFKRFNF